MFFLLSGSAASGKTTLARGLPALLDRVVCHDADEMVATTGEARCEQLELWVTQALAAQQNGQDFLLTSHSPFGELLACPSAIHLAGIAACLLDCADTVRIARMRARGIDPRWPPSQDLLNWAAWHWLHAWDPQWESRVIVANGPATHRYDRWLTWQQGDPRWQVERLDTTTLTPAATLHRLVAWITHCRTRPTALSATTRWWEATKAHEQPLSA